MRGYDRVQPFPDPSRVAGVYHVGAALMQRRIRPGLIVILAIGAPMALAIQARLFRPAPAPPTWRSQEGEGVPHPLLRNGVEIATWHQPGGVRDAPPYHMIREGGVEHPIDVLEDLRPFLKKIRGIGDALAYSGLVRDFLLYSQESTQKLGVPLILERDPALAGQRGRGGYYTPTDVSLWSVPPEITAYEGRRGGSNREDRHPPEQRGPHRPRCLQEVPQGGPAHRGDWTRRRVRERHRQGPR